MASTFTDLLRSLPDERLAALIRLRPDLIVPVPRDLAALAVRAQSRLSVARALDQLDRFQLEILDGLRLTRDPGGVSSLDQVLAVAAAAPAGADAGSVRAAVRRLRDCLLAYGPDESLRVVGAVDEVCGPHPAGLGRPAVELDPGSAEVVCDPARLRRTLLSAPAPARAVLERLAAGPPVGTLTRGLAGDEQVDVGGYGPEPVPEDPRGTGSPVGWLVSRGLLVATSETSVELPREVGQLLRRDTGPLGTLHPAPPVPAAATDAAKVDAAGAGQALEAVRRTGALLEAAAAEPVPLLRSGGLGIRDLRRLARLAGVDEPAAALLTEVAYAAGLLGAAERREGRQSDPAGGNGTAGGNGDLRPAAGYDAWSGTPIAARWHALATAWLAMNRQPGLVGQRDSKDRLIGPLSPEVERAGAPATRRSVLGVLARLPAGTTPTGEEAAALVAWHAPRRAAGREDDTRQALEEAAALGVTGLGGLTSYGAALLAELGAPAESPDDPLGIHAGDTPAGLRPAAVKLDAVLPAPVDQAVVQADLTVVVPGPPEPTLAAELDLVAERESGGGASVHRVTRDSLRRAYDAGYTAEDLHALFARRSRTPVPQALSYLVEDVARAHGGIRVGSAGAYLRSDDEALLAQVLADRRLASLGLRRLALTVLAGAASTARLLAELRGAGYAPVPEDVTGAPVLVRPRGRRAPARSPVTPPVDPFGASRMSSPRLLGIVEEIRRGDAAVRAARRAPARLRANGTPLAGGAGAQAHTEAIAVLQQAVQERSLVWVGYIDSHGGRTSRLLRAVSIGAGYLRAEDERTDTLHTFALHRITGASLDT
jgi:hypothetical protein